MRSCLFFCTVGAIHSTVGAIRSPLYKLPSKASSHNSVGDLVRVVAKPWQQGSNPDSHRSAYLHAKIATSKNDIGSCGLEVLEVGADGLLNSEHDPRPRCVLSGELFVSPVFRRQGVAQRLLREAEGHARWWGIGEMILMVQKSNKHALSLYKKMGYKQEERTKSHGSQICMRKHLFAPHNLLHSMMPELQFVRRR